MWDVSLAVDCRISRLRHLWDINWTLDVDIDDLFAVDWSCRIVELVLKPDVGLMTVRGKAHSVWNAFSSFLQGRATHFVHCLTPE